MTEAQLIDLENLKNSFKYKAEGYRWDIAKLTAQAEECDRAKHAVEKTINVLTKGNV